VLLALLLLGPPVLADPEPCDAVALAVASDMGKALKPSPTRTDAAPPVTTLQPDAFTDMGLSEHVLGQALKAFQAAWARGDTDRKLLTVIDYSLPSSQKRLWVIDLASNKVLFHQHVSHGKNSGGNTPTKFSNTNMSKQSNLGLLKTAETYYGKHGYSLRLDGLEVGFNDLARKRAIVVHGASYATQSFVDANGRLGRSWGCPAIDPAISRKLIDTIKGGSLIFGYSPKTGWERKSRYLNP